MSQKPNPKTQHTNKQYTNYLTLKNNCKTLFSSSIKPLPHLNPQNILSQNMRQVWLSNELPSSCIIDLRNLIDRPQYFNRIGFHCWHQYQSNPKLIQISYNNQNQTEYINWILLSKIRLQLLSGWQHFKIPTQLARNFNFIKINIIQNHAEQKPSDDQNHIHNVQQSTYLNQITLGYVEEMHDSHVQSLTHNHILHSRDKTFSDYRKLTSSQKEIKKLIQKMKQMSAQNDVMKRTIDQQNSIIIKLEQSMQKLTQTVIKLQKNQHLQQKRLKQLQQKSQNREYKNYPNEQYRKSIEAKRVSKQRELKSHQSHHKPEQVIQQHESHYSKPSSLYKTRQNQTSSKRPVVISNIEQNQSLSQFQDERINNKGKNYISMLEKLQRLIKVREEKQNKIRSNKKNNHTNYRQSRNTHHVPYSQQDQEQEDY